MRAGSMGVDTCLQNSGSVCYVLRVWWFFAVVAVMRGSAGSGACPRDSPSLVCVHAVRCERLDCRLRRPRLRPAAPAVLAICTLAAVRRRHPRWRHAACGCLRATGEVDAANAEGHWESGSFPQSSQDTVVKTIQTPSFALWDWAVDSSFTLDTGAFIRTECGWPWQSTVRSRRSEIVLECARKMRPRAAAVATRRRSRRQIHVVALGLVL